MEKLGFTRSAHAHNHLLQTPDTFIRAPFPGMVNTTAIVHAAPALGAAFLQYSAEMSSGGALAPTSVQRFLYVVDGRIRVDFDNGSHDLETGGFAYFPAKTAHRIASDGKACVAVIEKPYHALPGTDAPDVLLGNERAVMPQPLMNDPWLEVRTLLPADDRFDCAVNVMTFLPGASLPLVEIHVMEHGLLMLQGGGVYRLGDCWYPVHAGDFIWMAPFCPQWFGAVGKVPARYLIYKDFNRSPQAKD